MVTPAGDESALLRAVIEAPEDDGPRLIYADWLEERGRHERAELIRLQVALATTPPYEPLWQELWERSDELVRRHGEEWAGPLGRDARSWERGFLARLGRPA